MIETGAEQKSDSTPSDRKAPVPPLAVDKQPPAIVWGVETQIGLGIIRELGRAGIPVIALAKSERAIGLASKYVMHGEIALTPAPALLEQFRALSAKFGDCFAFAIAEADVAFLAMHRSELGRVRPLVPDSNALAHVLDKARTLEIAQRLGIGVPRTALVREAGEIESACQAFRMPVVLKWANPNAVAPLLRQVRLPLEKAEIAKSAEELRSALRRYDSIGQWPLVQEYCAGYGLGQFFFMHEGVALRRFQHRRIAEWPPEGGFSSVCDAVPLSEHAELQERSIALLKNIGWDGVAMVEYRYDPATRRANLMEINGRYWGSYPLAVQAGAGFALYSYHVQGLRARFALPAPREDLRSRMVATELKRLFRIWLQPGKIKAPSFERHPILETWRFVADFANPRARYYVFELDDPLPFLQDVKNVLRRE